jgi:hypothetical protein
MHNDLEFLRTQLAKLAHLLIDAEAAVGVTRRKELEKDGQQPSGPSQFLSDFKSLLEFLATPSRWRLVLNAQERRHILALFSAASEHLSEVTSGGTPFDRDRIEPLFDELHKLLRIYPLARRAGSLGRGGGGGDGGAGGDDYYALGYGPRGYGPGPVTLPHGQSLQITKTTETVRLGMSAPKTARPRQEFTARFVAYAPELEPKIEEMLASLSPRSTSHLGSKVSHNWIKGTEVTVRLHGQYIICSKLQQQFTWEGDFNLIDFDVQIQTDAPEGVTILKFDISIGSIEVGNLRLDIEVTKGGRVDAMQTIAANAARSAFASYASEDQRRVLDRVAAVAISAGLQIFMDCLSLHPGEMWKPRLEKEIRSSDLFLLFWSHHARESQWVDWEWRTAVRARGVGAIQLHPLETSKKAPPPEELKELHFGDLHILARQSSARKTNRSLKESRPER